jgi:luciferase-like monooxygenase
MLDKGFEGTGGTIMDTSRRANAVDGAELKDEILSARDAIETVRRAVAGWAGVTMHDHRFGGIEFRQGRRELGHLHRTIADLPFPRRIRDDLVARGRAKPHHVLPHSGWVTVPMRTASEVANVIDLFRLNYDREAERTR